MKYVYSIDYQALASDGDVVSRGFVTVSFCQPMTATDLGQFREDYLLELIKKWEADPRNRMSRGCPIAAIGIVHIWGGAES
jgi:hypothetical protein